MLYKKIDEIYDGIKSKEEKRDLIAFRSILDRTRTIIKQSSVPLSPPAVSKHSWDELKIATISTKNYLPEQPKKFTRNGIDYSLYFHDNNLSIYEEYLSNIEKAIQYKPDFICCNELAIPNFLDHRFQKKCNNLEEELQRIVDENGCYLISGSFHDKRTFHNICKIYYPSKDKIDGVTSPILHAKKTSAITKDEKVMIPYDRHLRYYHTKFITFGVLICLDSYDSSIISSILKGNKDLTASSVTSQ